MATKKKKARKKGRGKPKGGAYENTLCKLLAEAFKPVGILPDDVFRTKNSGATKSQPGDIQLSPRFAKLFPVLIEGKHYKTVKYKLGKSINKQDVSFHLFGWWEQVMREQKERKDRYGILCFRQNNCPDLVALQMQHFQELTGMGFDWKHFSWMMLTSWKNQAVVVIPLKEFLPMAVSRAQTRIMKAKLLRKGKV